MERTRGLVRNRKDKNLTRRTSLKKVFAHSIRSGEYKEVGISVIEMAGVDGPIKLCI